MAGDLLIARSQPEVDELWAPSQRARSWLTAGIAALVIDFVLAIAITALEVRHWGQQGLTPDVVLSYLAIVPQACVFLAWLVIAREAADRGLWKSTAGLFAAYLLASLVGVALIDGMPDGWIVAITVAAAIGIVGLLVFSLSKRPQFGVQPAEAAEFPGETADSDSGGWALHIIGGLGLVAIKFFIRRVNRGLPNIDLGVSGWALLEIIVVAIFAIWFFVWFAMAKIRLRHKLGGLAALVGGTELLILLAHAGMIAAGIWIVAAEVVANPLMDEDGIDKLLDPWLLRATYVSLACHGLWIVLTAALLASLWMRPEPEWRENFAK